MSCCDSNAINANLSCTLEYYVNHTNLFPSFSYMIYARPFTVIFTVVNVYLLVSTAIHVIRRSCREYTPHSIRTLPLSVLSSLSYFVLSMFDEYLPGIGTVECTTIHWLACIFYGLGSSHTYTILWCQQRTLYADPLLKHTVKKMARTLSKVTIIAIYVSLWAVVVLFQFTYCTLGSHVGCIVVWHNDNVLILVVAVFFIAVTALFHLLLLYLIAYPLLQDDRTTACGGAVSNLFRTARNDVERMLKRLLCCASVCIFMSQLMAIIVVLDAFSVVRVYIALPIQLDLLIGNFAAVCSFADWKDWIFPSIKMRNGNRKSSPTGYTEPTGS